MSLLLVNRATEMKSLESEGTRSELLNIICPCFIGSLAVPEAFAHIFDPFVR